MLATALTAVLGLAYVIAAPPSTDLAAAAYRSTLFSHVGFTLWDNSWYGGHHLPAYSLLAPALGAWLGPQLLNALAMVAATALFALLIDGCFPSRATRIAAVWFAIGASFALLANRVPYDLGLALGLGALVVLRGAHDSRDADEHPERNELRAGLGRHVAALALAVLCAVASPVAGAFLAIAGLAWTLTSRAANGWPRAWPIVFTFAALAPIGLLTLAFPEGGTQPFVASAFYPDIAAILLIAALVLREERERGGGPNEVGGHNRPAGPGEAGDPGDPAAAIDPDGGVSSSGTDSPGEAVNRLLLTGTLLYALALLGSYAIPSAVGGNVDRLGALLAGPVLACVLAPRHPRLLLVLAPLFLYWQLTAPLTDFASAASDPAVNASYYTPLLGELRTLGVGYGSPPTRPARIEVVPTVDHGEARWMAPHAMLARGWERQLDQKDGALFYDEAQHAADARALPRVALRGGRLLCGAARRAAGLLGEGRGAAAGPPTGLPAGDLALGALAAVRGARGYAPGAGARDADEHHHRLVHALRAPPREHDRADPLHPLLGDPRRTRLRARSAGGLDRGAGAQRRRSARRDRLLAGACLQPRPPLHPWMTGREGS